MEPMKESSNVTRLPGAEDIRLREPPHNFEAEQALLGAILINNAAYQRVAEFLRPEHFADPLHGKLFDSLSRLIERGQVVSAVTLKTYVEQDEDMKAAGGATYLARLAAASVHVIDATAFGQAVHDLYLRRQLIDLGEGVVNGAFGGDVDETALNQIEVAEKKLYDLASSGQTEGGFKPFRVALTEATVAAEAAYHRVGQLTGVASGLFQLDQLLGGLHRSDLIILAGRPSMGKTALATNIAFNAARAYREEIVERQAQGGRRRGGRLLLARNVVRAARHPHARRAGRSAVGEDPQGRAHKQRLRQGPVGQPRARAPELLHRRHAGAVDRGPAHPRPPAEAHARARAAGRRLPAAPRRPRARTARTTACRRSRRSPAA